MLWNVIYDFFVKYIFGGFTINGDYHISTISGIIRETNPVSDYGTGNLLSGFSFTSIYGEKLGLSLGNYLSLIATIISMVVIVLICCALIKKIYNMCAHIIG